MKRSVLNGVIFAFFVVTVAFAQGKPDFSGKWSAAAGGSSRMGRMMPTTVTQTDKTLTVEWPMGEDTVKSVYNLDGTESKNEMTMRGMTMTETATTKWVGNELLITTKSEGPNGPTENTQTWSLTSDGKLRIEQPRGDGSTMTMTYSKG